MIKRNQNRKQSHSLSIQEKNGVSNGICVHVQDICKQFPTEMHMALQDISFELKQGQITGLVGPDGAGKTTLIRILLGLLQPTQGEITIYGFNPQTQKDELHALIGYMPQKFGLYEDLTVRENINLYADLKALTIQQRKKQFEALLKFTGLSVFQERLAGQLSGGMKQKLGLGCALLGEPSFLLLDEPGVGVDPISRRELMNMVRELSSKGMSVLWSTSYLDEAAGFDNVILLNEGKLIYQGNPLKLTKKIEGHVFLLNGYQSVPVVKNNSSFLTEKERIDEKSVKETVKEENFSPRALMRHLSKSGENITDAVIYGDDVRLVIKDKDLIKKWSSYLKPTPARFEDAVIDILGGYTLKASTLAENIQLPDLPEIVIEAKHLTKKYGNFTAAEDISFQIRRGEIFGLLGPNGAGKSTSFKMMCGLAKPTQGEAFILGINMQKHPLRARQNLGYMAQKFSLFSPLTVLQNLKFFAGIYGLAGKNLMQRIKKMIALFALKPYLKQKAGELPLGFKQRLALACAVMHNPPILFLDEPTSGVDPLTRREFWNHINALVEKGVTVMVTTHFMDEAEYCDRIALIYQGKAIRMGPPAQLKKKGETMEDAFIRIIEETDTLRKEEKGHRGNEQIIEQTLSHEKSPKNRFKNIHQKKLNKKKKILGKKEIHSQKSIHDSRSGK